MKMKLLLLIGTLIGVSILLSGCATGLTATAWPSVAADASNAYVAGGPYVYAVSLQTGLQAWRYPDKASTANPFYATPALTPDGKQLIVGGFDHKLYSLNVQTGAQNWVFDQARDRWIGGALVAGDMIYAPNADYNLYALDLQGNLKWTFTADQSLWAAPVSDGQRVYFGTLGHKVYAVDAASGAKAWEKSVDGAILGSPALETGGLLFVDTYGGTVFALNPADGTQRWKFTASNWIWSGPALDGGTIYLGDSDGMVYSLSAANGQENWHQKMNGPVIGSPFVGGSTITVGTETGSSAANGSLVVLDATGASLHNIPLSGKAYSTPVVAGDLTLVALAGDATQPILAAIDQNGVQKWTFTPPK